MNEVQEIEISLEHCKEEIGKANLIASLHNNPEFQRIILDGFFEKYPAELVRSLTDPVIANNQSKREEVLRTLEGISVLHGYLRATYQKGQMAKQSLEEYEQQLLEARNNQ